MFLLDTVQGGVISDMVDPDNIPGGYGSGISIDMPSFWLGAIIGGIVIWLIYTIANEIRSYKNDKATTENNDHEDENNSKSE